MAEALERMLLKRFFGELKPTIPDYLIQLSAEPHKFNENSISLTGNLEKSFESFKDRVRAGRLGKTAQFWLTYLDLMRIQHFAHLAVQENNFDLRL